MCVGGKRTGGHKRCSNFSPTQKVPEFRVNSPAESQAAFAFAGGPLYPVSQLSSFPPLRAARVQLPPTLLQLATSLLLVPTGSLQVLAA